MDSCITLHHTMRLCAFWSSAVLRCPVHNLQVVTPVAAHCAAIQPAAWFTAPSDATSEQEDIVAEAANGSTLSGTIVLDVDGLPHRREINDKSQGGCTGCWQLYLRYSRIRRWGLKCVLPVARIGMPANSREYSAKNTF